jgi:hypothetical protein
LLLAGENPREYQTESSLPQISRLAGADRRGFLLVILAAIYGWRIFGPHLSAVTSYGSSTKASQDLLATLRRIADAADDVLAQSDRGWARQPASSRRGR